LSEKYSPIPTSFLAMKTPMTEVKSSGAEPPAAMNVAPATSGLISSWNRNRNDSILIYRTLKLMETRQQGTKLLYLYQNEALL